jgi:hypothetical protein
MKSDWYVRATLTVIAASLVYIGALLTPLPPVAAQVTPPPGSTLRPGEYTGPAEVVVVGWQLPDGAGLPVQLAAPANVTITNEVRLSGPIETRAAPQTSQRVVLVGWEDAGAADRAGRFHAWRSEAAAGLPVTSTTP